MNVDVLGPFQITVDRNTGVPLELSGRHTAALLAYLTARRDQAIPLTQVVDAIGHRDGPVAMRTLRGQLRQVAAALPAGTLTVGTAVRFEVPPGAVDADRFVGLVRQSRDAWEAGDRDVSMARTCAALAFWRSDPYPELSDCLDVLPMVQHLRSLYVDAVELYQEFDIVEGVSLQTVARARQLAAAYPERRTLRLQLARALHLAGRQVDALAELRETAAVFGDTPLTRHITTLIARRDPVIAHTSVLDPADRTAI